MRIDPEIVAKELARLIFEHQQNTQRIEERLRQQAMVRIVANQFCRTCRLFKEQGSECTKLKRFTWHDAGYDCVHWRQRSVP